MDARLAYRAPVGAMNDEIVDRMTAEIVESAQDRVKNLDRADDASDLAFWTDLEELLGRHEPDRLHLGGRLLHDALRRAADESLDHPRRI